MLTITAVAASALGFLYVKLSLNVIKHRRQHGVSIGDAGHEDLHRAIRAQANLAEYAPIGLILLACLEFNEGSLWVTMPLASTFVVGRLIHPIGMKDKDSPMKPRVKGMQLTILSLIGLSAANLIVIGTIIFSN